MNWVIIVILIILVLVFSRMKYMKHKIFLVFFILIILFLYVTSTRILSGESINWKSVAGVEKGIKIYFAWLGGAFDNLKVLTTNAVKMDWTQKNKTDTAIKNLGEK